MSYPFSWRLPFCSKTHEPEPKDPEIRIVLLGKTDDKKRAWDTILGPETLEASPPRKPQMLGIREWKERKVVLIDAPDISQPDEAKVSRCVLLSRPGPHALLLVTRPERFNEADRSARPWIQAAFGQEALKSTIPVFAGENPGSMEHDVSHPDLQHTIQKHYSHHSVIFSREQPGESLAEEILSKVEEMAKKNPNSCLDITGMDERLKEMKTKGEEGAQMDGDVEKAQDAMEVQGMGKEGYQEEALPGSHHQISEEAELRLILVGKTGAGKSVTGNTILGEERFDSRLELSPVTKSCRLGIREWGGKRVIVMDTPAIFDSEESHNSDEIDRCLRFSSPGPHALVHVAQLGRFTEEDRQAAKRVQKIFGPEAQSHTVVVLTHREDLRTVSLEEYVSGTDNKPFRELIKASGDRYCGFNNNKVGKEQERQAEELLSAVEKMVLKNKGKPYCVPKPDTHVKSQINKRKAEKEGQKPHNAKKKGTEV